MRMLQVNFACNFGRYACESTYDESAIVYRDIERERERWDGLKMGVAGGCAGRLHASLHL